jgi:hypothetical protein
MFFRASATPRARASCRGTAMTTYVRVVVTERQ